MADNTEVSWPSEDAGTVTDWYQFTMAGDPDEQGRLLTVRLNVSFLLSSWKCIFGQGCPGVLISGAMIDRGCCQIGVGMEHTDDDYKRVRGYVEQLTEEDLDEDLLEIVRSKDGKGWRYRDHDADETRDAGGQWLPWHTTVVDGACVLANRATGNLKAPGCSLHRLANRLGLHHSETKPDICWQIPMAVSQERDEDSDTTMMTVDYTPGTSWGHTNMRELGGVAYWCTETPDAFPSQIAIKPSDAKDFDLYFNQVTANLVFRTNETELRKLMTDRVYDEMVGYLKQIVLNGGRRSALPGESLANGRPVIPLLVKSRLAQWQDDELEGSEDALARSVPYMREHTDSKPAGYKLPKTLRRPAVVPKQNGVAAPTDVKPDSSNTVLQSLENELLKETATILAETGVTSIQFVDPGLDDEEE